MADQIVVAFFLDFTHLEIILIEVVKNFYISICYTSSGVKLSVSMIYFSFGYYFDLLRPTI